MRRYMKPSRGNLPFHQNLLPRPAAFYKSKGLKLTGGGEWKNARCLFHDNKPSFRALPAGFLLVKGYQLEGLHEFADQMICRVQMEDLL